MNPANPSDAVEYQLYTGTMAAAEVAQKFGGLIAARFRRHLADGRVPADRPLLTAGATHEGMPVGLTLGAPQADCERAAVHSLGVVPNHRRRGLGTALLGALERNLRQQGTSTVQASYRSSIEHRAALERILERRAWDAPRAVRRLYRSSLGTIRHAPLLKANALPKGFSLFDWRDLTPDERDAIRRRQDSDLTGAHPEALDPFQLPDRVEERCSIGVRRDGRIAGWMIVHRLREDVMQYTSLFVQPTVHRHQVASVLLAEAIRRQIHRTDASRGVWMVDLANAPILRFIDRHLRPYVDTEADVLLVGKRLA